ncbi:MAG: hypothetical protein IT585_13855 [candidate division Zixibacteria bacterium]|nr:hypothetical protein [candidate division Zixibacteria bacterium]
MPAYNVYFFIIKKPMVPMAIGASGSIMQLTSTHPSVAAAQATIVTRFKEVLRQLMQDSVASIPHEGSRDQTVAVIEVPADASSNPNWAGLTVDIKEPIVYLTGSRARRAPSDPTERRAGIILAQELQRPPGFQNVTQSDIDTYFNTADADAAGDNSGRTVIFSDDFPLVSEVFVDRITIDMQDAQYNEKYAQMLARAAWHEICHGKAECENRATNPRWQAAVADIHAISGVGIAAATVQHNTAMTAADRQTMGRHMLCPVAFYQLGVPVAGQCFHRGTRRALTPNPPPPPPPPPIDLNSGDPLFP